MVPLLHHTIVGQTTIIFKKHPCRNRIAYSSFSAPNIFRYFSPRPNPSPRREGSSKKLFYSYVYYLTSTSYLLPVLLLPFRGWGFNLSILINPVHFNLFCYGCNGFYHIVKHIQRLKFHIGMKTVFKVCARNGETLQLA